MKILEKELDLFWEWSKTTPEKYAVQRKPGEWETDYPNWDAIYEATEYTLDHISSDADIKFEIDQILTAMAIDNEVENILLLLETKTKIIDEVILHGCKHIQPQARWQIAELIKRTHSNKHIEILIDMILNDNDNYVKRRALVSLIELDIRKAKKYAKIMINNVDDNFRVISENILNNHS